MPSLFEVPTSPEVDNVVQREDDVFIAPHDVTVARIFTPLFHDFDTTPIRLRRDFDTLSRSLGHAKGESHNRSENEKGRCLNTRDTDLLSNVVTNETSVTHESTLQERAFFKCEAASAYASAAAGKTPPIWKKAWIWPS